MPKLAPKPIPDRSNDKPPPADRNETAPCQCGARMVGRIDKSNAHQGYLVLAEIGHSSDQIRPVRLERSVPGKGTDEDQ